MTKPSKIASDPRADLAKRLGLPLWFVWVFPLCIVFGTLEFFHLGNQQSALDQAMQDLPKQIAAQIDAKLANLKTELIEKFLSEAKRFTAAGDFRQAAASVKSAAILTEVARQERVPAEPHFFVTAIQSLDAIGPVTVGPSMLAEPVHAARVALASYRSSLYKLPPELQQPQQFRKLNLSTIAKLLGREGGAIWVGPPGKDMVKVPPPRNGKFLFGADDIFFEGGQQTLDNASWKNVLFINMHIIYRGGPVELDGVRFINCTFDFVSNQRGAQIADYAALDNQFTKVS